MGEGEMGLTTLYSGSSTMLAGIRRSVLKSDALKAARVFHTRGPALGGHGISQHRPDTRNDPDMHWDFTEDNYAHIERIIQKYPLNYKQSAVMPLLDLAQRQQGVWPRWMAATRCHE